MLKQFSALSCIIFVWYSAKATDEYESARRKVATFINASDSKEIVFTRNATEAINLVAYSWGLSNLKPEDEVFHYGSIFLWISNHLIVQKEPEIVLCIFLSVEESIKV